MFRRFSAISFQKQRNVQTAWPSVRTIFSKILSAFKQNSWVFWITKYRPDMLPRRPDGLQRLPKQCQLLKFNSVLNNDWSGLRMVLLWRLNIFIVISKTLRGIRTPSKARSDGCTGIDCFVFDFARTLHGHLLEACDQLLSLIWTLSEYMKILNWKTNHPVNLQPIHKVLLLSRILPT
jgi:hypothetical protein